MCRILRYVRLFYYELALMIFRSLNIIPQHVGFICDGNRTYAKRNRTTVEEAYALGVQKILECTCWCKTIGVKEVTFYLLGLKNLLRTDDHVRKIFDALENYLHVVTKGEQTQNADLGCKYRFVGDLSLIPEKLRKLCLKLETSTNTKNNPNIIINLAIAYSGKTEMISKCVNHVGRMRQSSTNDLNENVLNRNGYESDLSDLNLIIRSSARNRLSDFLTWQAVNSLIDVSEVQWPDFVVHHLLKALIRYKLFRARLPDYK